MALTLLRLALGIILLSEVSFIPTYHKVCQIPVLQAGLSPMNTTFLSEDWFLATATDYFGFYFPALLADNKVSHSVPPVSCNGPSCQGFFLPGLPSDIRFDPTTPNISATDYPEATSFIQQDAPGYQIDFSEIDIAIDPPVTLADCRLYGLSVLAVQICLKQANNSMLAGSSLLSLIDSSLEFLWLRTWQAGPLPQYHRLAYKCSLQYQNDHT